MKALLIAGAIGSLFLVLCMGGMMSIGLDAVRKHGWRHWDSQSVWHGIIVIPVLLYVAIALILMACGY